MRARLLTVERIYSIDSGVPCVLPGIVKDVNYGKSVHESKVFLYQLYLNFFHDFPPLYVQEEHALQ